MKFEIKSRWTSEVQFTAEIECADNAPFSAKLGFAVEFAFKSGANLSRANLSRANLSRADLSRANLSGADLSGADLSGADLSGADLFGADLSGADFSGASLSGADLSGAVLWRANLSGANLSGANLFGANLSRAKNATLAISQTRIIGEGTLIGWKKLKDGAVAKLRIPEDARRSHAFGRKCRAEFVDVIEGEGVSIHDGVTKYAPGLRVTCHHWEPDWQIECAGGIHFYITREEAEAHQ